MPTATQQTIEEHARQVAEPLIAAEGLELVDVEYKKEHAGWILRLFIDKPGGIGIEDCTKASHAVETALDVEDFIPQEYQLEVSSPGLNRPLTRPAHYQKAAGKKVRVKTFGPIGTPPRKNFLGTLKGVAQERIIISVEGAGDFEIPFKDIAAANLEFDFDASSTK
jgi:ribosome maturation factor RimP